MANATFGSRVFFDDLAENFVVQGKIGGHLVLCYQRLHFDAGRIDICLVMNSPNYGEAYKYGETCNYGKFTISQLEIQPSTNQNYGHFSSFKEAKQGIAP